MNAIEILDQLKSVGAVVRAEEDGLFVDAPASLLTDDFVEKLRQYKPALLELLTTDPRISNQCCPNCGQPMTLQQREPETYFCPACRLWAIEGRLQ